MVKISKFLNLIFINVIFNCVFVGNVFSDDQTTNESYELKTYSVMVGINSLSLNNFIGAAFSGKIMISSNLACRLGVDLSYNYDNSFRPYIPPSTGSINMNIGIQYYLNSLDPVKAYFSIGVTGGYSDEYIYLSGRRVPIGFNVVFGAEWLFTKQVGFFVEYGLGALATFYLDNTNSNIYQISSLGLHSGLAFYF